MVFKVGQETGTGTVGEVPIAAASATPDTSTTKGADAKTKPAQRRGDPTSWNFCYVRSFRACKPEPPPRRVGLSTPYLAWRSVLPAPDMAAPISSDAAKLRALILSKLTYQLGKAAADASDRDWFVATALAVRDGIVDRFLRQMGVGPSGSGTQIY